MQGTLNDASLIYQQIAQMLEDDILRSVYAPGDQVPSTNELARAFHINPATAAKGINLLVSDGVLYKRRGLGMFVTQEAPAILKHKRRQAFLDAYVAPMAREARFLGLTGEELADLVRTAFEKGEN